MGSFNASCAGGDLADCTSTTRTGLGLSVRCGIRVAAFARQTCYACTGLRDRVVEQTGTSQAQDKAPWVMSAT